MQLAAQIKKNVNGYQQVCVPPSQSYGAPFWRTLLSESDCQPRADLPASGANRTRTLAVLSVLGVRTYISWMRFTITVVIGPAAVWRDSPVRKAVRGAARRISGAQDLGAQNAQQGPPLLADAGSGDH